MKTLHKMEKQNVSTTDKLEKAEITPTEQEAPPPPPPARAEMTPQPQLDCDKPGPTVVRRDSGKQVRSHAIISNTNYLQSSERTTTIAPSSPNVSRSRSTSYIGTPEAARKMQTSTQTSASLAAEKQADLDQRSDATTPIPVLSEWLR